MISNNRTVLNGITLYHPMIEIWSGTVRVKRMEDLKSASDLLPPSAILSDGRKRIVRKEPLRPLLAIRKRVDRMLRASGFGFMGGIAIPESKSSEIEAELPKLEAEFIDAVNALCSNLPAEYQILSNEFPDWAEMLDKSRLTEDDVRSRCRFDVVSYRVAAPDQSTKASNRFHKIVDSALPTLLKDIADDAEKMYIDSVQGKSRLSSKTVAMVSRLVDKLDTFGFLDPRVAPMADALAAKLQGMPTSGFLSPADSIVVNGVLVSMTDPEALLLQGSAHINSTIDETTEDAIDDANANDLLVGGLVSTVHIPAVAPTHALPANASSALPKRFLATF